MARPRKKGLDYFTNDVSFYQDIKIRKLIRHNGIQAVAVYHILLCQIYSVGYYLEWDDDIPFIISELSGLEEDEIVRHLNYCTEVGLFDKTLFEGSHILTSSSIQSRYIEISVAAKRKICADMPFLIVPIPGQSVSSEETRVSSVETAVISEETPISSEINSSGHGESDVSSEFSTQRKEKERKEYIDSLLRSESPSSAEQPTDSDGEINFLGFMALFNRTMQEHKAVIATITDMTKKRREAVGARCRKYGQEALRKVVLNAATSPFLNGENKESWVADFNWLFKPNNFVKVLEGNYNHDLKGHNDDSVLQQSDDYEIRQAEEKKRLEQWHQIESHWWRCQEAIVNAAKDEQCKDVFSRLTLLSYDPKEKMLLFSVTRDDYDLIEHKFFVFFSKGMQAYLPGFGVKYQFRSNQHKKQV